MRTLARRSLISIDGKRVATPVRASFGAAQAAPARDQDLTKCGSEKPVGIKCSVVAIAQFQDDVAELAEFGITSFNMYSEAGSGLARHALQVLGAQPATA